MERGHLIKVLDDGFVRLVDWMGSDEEIVQTARVSTGRGFVSWEPYRRCRRPECDQLAQNMGGQMVGIAHDDEYRECTSRSGHDWLDFPRGDLGILEYMMANRHTSPFEFCELVVHVRVPMDCWRQWIRHRTANVSEYSTRYSDAIDSAAKTAPDAWRKQGATNRQGSVGFLPTKGDAVDSPDGYDGGAYLSHREAAFQQLAREIYEERLAFGVAK